MVKADAGAIFFKNSIQTLSDGFVIPLASGWKERVKLLSPVVRLIEVKPTITVKAVIK